MKKTTPLRFQKAGFFGSLSLAILGSLTSIAAKDITNDVYYLYNITNGDSDNFYIRSTRTYKGANGSFTQNYKNGKLIFGNTIASSGTGEIWFGGNGWNSGSVGYITANFNAKDAYLTGTLGAGNAWSTGGGATFNLNFTNEATLQDWNIQFNKAGTQNSHLTLSANKITAKNFSAKDSTGGSVSFIANTFDFHAKILQGNTFKFENKEPATKQNTGKVTIDNLSISGGYFYADKLKDTLKISTINASNATFKTKDINIYALDANNNASYMGETNTTTITGNWNITTSAGTTHNEITLQNVNTFNAKGSITLQTWGAYSTKFIATNIHNLNLERINLNLYTGGDTGSNTFDVSNVSQKVSINNFTATRGNIHTNTDFHITNLDVKTADFNATTDFYGKQDTTYNITNLKIFGGWGATTKGSAVFHAGKTLTINNATISDWSTLDASKVSTTTIDTLNSSYATIKAGANLEVKNATFNNTINFLEAQGNVKIDNIVFKEKAELHVKSGTALQAEKLTMQNGSALVAQANNQNSNFSGDTTIKEITIDNSRIYANNLTTEKITIKNNATIWLKNDNSGLYKNDGDLNIDDGSKLIVYGNMENTGSLNFGLKPSNSELIHTTGYFKFNMDDSEETKKFTITNIVDGVEKTEEVELSTPKSKINIYASSKDLITGQVYTLIKADGGIQFLKNKQVYTNLSESTEYGKLSQIFAQNIYFFDKDNNNSALNVNFVSNTDNNILSFSIPTTGVYVDSSPFIKPGVWGFGGNAVFGIMNGAGGLAQDYTLRLEPKKSDEEATKGKEVIYYLKDYTYHNSGNTKAVFQIDATGSKFILGKDRDTAGHTGEIYIGNALARSTMHIKADDIYLGGKIFLGDGALISGHLLLETTNNKDSNFVGSNDSDHTSEIHVRNHSSLIVKADSFDYQGTIFLNGNGTVSDEVTMKLDLSGKKKITINDKQYDSYIYKLVVRDAKKLGDSDQSGGITAKNFYISTLEVKKGNNTYNEFLTDIGQSKVDNLILESGTSTQDHAVLVFKDKGVLEADHVVLGSYSKIDASNLEQFKILQDLSMDNAEFIFSKKSQEIDIKKILKFENSTLTTGHFDSYGLSITIDDKVNTITSNASFYQSADDKDGYATIKITGEYKAISSLIPLINNSHITFNKLNELQAEDLSIQTTNAYGSSINLKEVKKATINTINLKQNTSVDTAYPTFDARGSKNLELTINNLNAINAYFYANNGGNTTLHHTNITNTEAYFNNLVIAQNGVFSYNSSSKISINGNFDLKGELQLQLQSQNLNPIQVTGRANIYASNNVNFLNINNIAMLKGVQINKEYDVINATNGINFYIDNQNTNNHEEIFSHFGFYQDNMRVDDGDTTFLADTFVITKILTNHSIGFKIDTKDSYKINPFDKERIEYYFFKKGGEDWIYSLANLSENDIANLKDLYGIMSGHDPILQNNQGKHEDLAKKEWLDIIFSHNADLQNLQNLMIDKNNAIWANDIIIKNNLSYFQEIIKKIRDAREQLGSINSKSSSADAVRLATDTNRMSRLVKLSSTKNQNTFAKVIKKLEKQAFADNDLDLDLAALYQQAIREEYKNNIWATAIGAANFADGRNGTLYGINVGYDRYIKNVIIGGYAAYAYSTYYGDLLQNNAHNFNTGIYTRIFIDHGEFDLNASFTVGWNNEYINSKEIVTRQLNQNYDYNSYISNVNFNYGYLFYLQEKSFVLKPQIGLSHFYIASSKIRGDIKEVFYKDLNVSVKADGKQALAINLALESRKYLSETSYWYVTAGASQDFFVSSSTAKTIDFIGENTLDYHKNNTRNLRFLLNVGGEFEVYKQTFINLGLGSKVGVFYKDLGISANAGVRYIF
ncbi:vacuolating cytotoxin domain-containing protein [Helicobacter sp. faydin-H20]|uniref:vacuolating cytotoxin domain-containing protein n=1 Tax=Helicobacter anatolicus TaxID=2905874 RepID=UPI001E2F9007|nr:vacuolating cytotoxin domain-containing protein [Helicobacter anatolicus]MCE3036214.1 vacuolating cytotoxin domain-containing protein [Helicobacter anatolicus]